MNLTIIVRGTPAPQGSKKHVGHGVMVESSAKVKPWREAVKWAAVAEWDRQGRAERIRGPVTVEIVFTLPKPASAPKQRRTWPSRRPDIDKLLRSSLDGLSDSGVWVDDGQVVFLTAAKCYPSEGTRSLPSPGAWIRISEVTG